MFRYLIHRSEVRHCCPNSLSLATQCVSYLLIEIADERMQSFEPAILVASLAWVRLTLGLMQFYLKLLFYAKGKARGSCELERFNISINAVDPISSV